ncbi:phage tail tape measure protein, TP901 family, core region [Serratia liquefaciens]|uniref:phage tail tape measure protein n=1 Tax=Serratia liquefaciens TaxID=614 RepID=UPI002179A488|nr:phage tail tape measure protein [Serratia liquefaciens]CAI0963768.1 phage tail tape measure protein, TP901 family, core region [Serratia liquefaciens]CAI1120776.1 phage tail tape measure protein, TP901 family, core region [Serratia liquefaciens]
MADSIQLKAIITAVDQLSGPLKGMQRNLKGFGKEFSSTIAGVAALGAGVVTAMAIPINQAIQFESVMADVRKVVDFDTPDQFKQMGEDVLNLSTRLPMAAEGIGQIVAAGGQAGIAKNELLSFAESAVKMGVAFDQTAEESGQMMATWRTAFKMTQTDVVGLADKINYLGNTGPANAAKISEVVTRIGPLGEVAGVASGEIAAMGATIAGMGVESEIASTGIKNFMLSLTAGGAATASQKKALRALKISPKALAEDMQKDAKGTMLKVLDSMAKVPKAKQAAVMTALFGKESLGAIAPLLTNLDLLRSNFQKVSDAQTYGGSMQKEYASRAATTANAIQLFKNQMNAVSVTLGEIFLPALNKGMQKLMPFIEQLRNWVKENPELIKSVVKFAGALAGLGVAVGGLSRVFKILNSVMNLSPAKLAVAALAAGALLIIENWDQVGPVIKDVWQQVDKVAQAVGGWETVLGGVGLYMTGAFTVKTIGSLQTALTLAKQLSGVLGRISSLGVATIQIAVAIYMFEQLKQIADAAKQADHTDSFWDSLKNRVSAGGWYNNQQEVNRHQAAGYKPSVSLLKPGGQQQQPNGELLVRFENSPPGMRVAPVAGSSPGVSYDVGYSRFAKQ